MQIINVLQQWAKKSPKFQLLRGMKWLRDAGTSNYFSLQKWRGKKKSITQVPWSLTLAGGCGALEGARSHLQTSQQGAGYAACHGCVLRKEGKPMPSSHFHFQQDGKSYIRHGWIKTELPAWLLGSDAIMTHVILFKTVLPLTFSPPYRSTLEAFSTEPSDAYPPPLPPYTTLFGHCIFLRWPLLPPNSAEALLQLVPSITKSFLSWHVFFSLLFYTLHKNHGRFSFTFTRSPGNYCHFPYILHRIKKRNDNKMVNR